MADSGIYGNCHSFQGIPPPGIRRMQIRAAFLVLFLALSVSLCRSREKEPERTYENGVEIVNNGLEPYVIKGEANHLRLEQKLVIDFEAPDLTAVGIPKIWSFNVDSQGNIYVWCRQSSENFIFKFDPAGKFARAFGRSGEGPGEIAALDNLGIDERDEIIISDDGRKRLILMSASGDMLNELQLPSKMNTATLLPNGNILASRSVFNPEEGIVKIQIVLCDQGLNELAVLNPTEELPNWLRAKKINGLGTAPTLGQGSISKEHIYVGNKQSGYQIWVYDLEGNPIRRIKKDYEPVAVPEDIKKTVLEVFDMPIHKSQKSKLYFPDSMPALQYLFTDDQGRLFVMTFEKGERPGHFMYDFFNSDGIFVGRTSLDNTGNESLEIWGGPFEVRAKNNLLYYLRAKESGFQELVVCRMIWTE